MGTSELEGMAVRELLEQARETLREEHDCTAENADDYIFQLAQARKLFLADAAAEIVTEDRHQPALQFYRPG